MDDRLVWDQAWKLHHHVAEKGSPDDDQGHEGQLVTESVNPSEQIVTTLEGFASTRKAAVLEVRSVLEQIRINIEGDKAKLETLNKFMAHTGFNAGEETLSQHLDQSYYLP